MLECQTCIRYVIVTGHLTYFNWYWFYSSNVTWHRKSIFVSFFFSSSQFRHSNYDYLATKFQWITHNCFNIIGGYSDLICDVKCGQ